MENKLIVLGCWAALALAVAWGCGDDGGSPGGTDTDSDTDADSDSDTDTNATLPDFEQAIAWVRALGEGCQTTAESDGGHFLGRAAEYFDGDPPDLCEGY